MMRTTRLWSKEEDGMISIWLHRYDEYYGEKLTALRLLKNFMYCATFLSDLIPVPLLCSASRLPLRHSHSCRVLDIREKTGASHLDGLWKTIRVEFQKASIHLGWWWFNLLTYDWGFSLQIDRRRDEYVQVYWWVSLGCDEWICWELSNIGRDTAIQTTHSNYGAR